ncbi:MAG TPA: nucleotide sugar dehydrogenase [bacterium]|nr:nucleotide sugar dehydrogenase [bacterium]HPR87884.1 nucleotide sugar dehydrogenase [bacterium]
MKISIFGLGYVGCVSAACLAEMGHEVTGVDINAEKVRLINQGHSPIVEEGLDGLIARQRQEGRLRAATEPVVADRDLVFICVGTPSNANGSLHLGYVQRVCTEIGAALRGVRRRVTVVLRSTVLPGVAETVALPALEAASGLRAGIDFGFALNPEFLREGTSVYDFYHPPKTVIGVFDPAAAELLAELYADLEAPLFRLAPGEAAMIKYADNAFHAIKVAFANEIGRLCKSFQVDSRQVMNVFVQDTKLNLSPYYLKPGFAFGGSCLPKDIRALSHRARQEDVDIPLLNAAMASNEEHIRHALRLVKAYGRKKIGILGLSFKHGTDDLRESPVVTLVEELMGKGYEVAIFDRNVSVARLMGANKEYIEREVPHIARLMCSTMEELMARSEVVVIGNNGAEHDRVLGDLRNGHKIIDLSGLKNGKHKQMEEVNYEGICW